MPLTRSGVIERRQGRLYRVGEAYKRLRGRRLHHKGRGWHKVYIAASLPVEQGPALPQGEAGGISPPSAR